MLEGPGRWEKLPSTSTPPPNPDSIHTYLSTPVQPELSSSILEYWDRALTRTPGIATMGLAFCSAPATTVDGERAFSEGRNQLAWNQHQMSQETFQSKMELGSWADTPWFSIDEAEAFIAEYSSALRPLASMGYVA